MLDRVVLAELVKLLTELGKVDNIASFTERVIFLFLSISDEGKVRIQNL